MSKHVLILLESILHVKLHNLNMSTGKNPAIGYECHDCGPKASVGGICCFVDSKIQEGKCSDGSTCKEGAGNYCKNPPIIPKEFGEICSNDLQCISQLTCAKREGDTTTRCWCTKEYASCNADGTKTCDPNKAPPT
jgi:hypothetical protein